MTDAERAAALADEMQSRADFAWSHGGLVPTGSMSFSDFVLLSRGARLLAEQSTPSPASADLREVVARGLARKAGMEFVFDDAYPANVAAADEFRADADAAISAISAAGLVTLPREPTEAMIEAWVGETATPLDVNGYDAMVRAALAAKEPAP